MVDGTNRDEPTRNTCQYTRCIALAVGRGVYCAVHARLVATADHDAIQRLEGRPRRARARRDDQHAMPWLPLA